MSCRDDSERGIYRGRCRPAGRIVRCAVRSREAGMNKTRVFYLQFFGGDVLRIIVQLAPRQANSYAKSESRFL